MLRHFLGTVAFFLCSFVIRYFHLLEGTLPISTPQAPPNPELPLPPSRSLLHVYNEAAICSDSKTCSDIGKNILIQNGSVVDAGIATLLCNGLLAMQSMGLGGGMFMNVYIRSEKRSYSILGREHAPIDTNPEKFKRFRDYFALLQSSQSIAVPGEVMGYAVAHERFGRLRWRALVKPTIDLCHEGFPLSIHQRDALYVNTKMIKMDYHLRHMFYDYNTGDFYKIGTRIKPPFQLCKTFELLAKYGPRSFYRGVISKMLLSDLHNIGSPIVAADLQRFNVSIVDSIVLPMGNHDIHFPPPPSSGYILAYIMNIMRRYQNHYETTNKFNETDIHRIVEALKFGFAKRWLLDMYTDQNLLDKLKLSDYGLKHGFYINDSSTQDNIAFYGAKGNIRTHFEGGTTHISVLAPNGDAMSATSTINYYFGSGRMGIRTGILFNNAMADFSFDHIGSYFKLASMPNRNLPLPQALPMSSMTPLIVVMNSTWTGLDDVRLVVGAAGGPKILSALTQLLVRVLWMGDNIKEAIDAPRFHHQLIPMVVEYEYGLIQPYVEALEVNGHTTMRYRERGSAICAVEQRNGRVFANADYRKEGDVAGF